MSEKPTKEELTQQLADKGIGFEVPDEMLEAVAGGYDPNAYNPAALAGKMNSVIADAKRDGKSKDYMLEYQILRSMAAHAQFGNKSPEYQLGMDKYRYIEENWG